eukprot:SAG11_NODE_24151_length_377_cov_1.079137_1_plen_54_part_01
MICRLASAELLAQWPPAISCRHVSVRSTAATPSLALCSARERSMQKRATRASAW